MKWLAQWINPEDFIADINQSYPASYLKKSFKGTRGEKYTLDATACGIYACFLNGNRVGAEVLTPGPTQEPKIYVYQEYDVSDLVKEGDNEIVFVLLNGWHRTDTIYPKGYNRYGNTLALLAQIVDKNGLAVLKTDNTWLASQEGPIRYSDMMGGETCDLNKEDIVNWHPVTSFQLGTEAIVKETRHQILEHEHFEGKDLTTPKGEHVIDFGQNLAGYVQIDVQARKGQKVVLELFESLDKDGNFQNGNFQAMTPGVVSQKITLICHEGHNVYKPLGGYWGFRYARVSSDGEVKGKDLTAIAVYNDIKFISSFNCGQTQVNQFFKNAVWSFKSNLVGIPTDCPTREKSGWTADYHAFIYTAMYLAEVYDDSIFYLDQMVAGQGEDGHLMVFAPNPIHPWMHDGSSGWCDAIAIIPEKLLERYDNPEALKKYYDSMKKFADYDLKRAKESTRPEYLNNPYKDYVLDHGFHFGEWLEPGDKQLTIIQDIMKNGAPEVTTAYLYNTCRIVSKAAGLLGKDGEEKFYAQAAEGCKKAYNWQFVKNGQLVDSTHMCNYVRPLQFGLLEPEVAKKAASHLNQMLIAAHYVPNTGFLTTHILLKVLVDYGYADTAYKTFLHQGIPGWMYPISKGATTIWEQWDGIDKNGGIHGSLNHYTYGAAVSFLFDSVCGIRLERGKLTICPHPYEEMGYAEASYDSPFGKIVSNWKYIGHKASYHIEVPIQAEVILPDGTTKLVEKGKYDL